MKKIIPRLLPSEHEAARTDREKEQADAVDAKQRAEVRLRAVVDSFLKSEEGRLLWAHIFNLCGYSKSSLTRMAGGDIAPMSTECKEAQRLVYIELRKLATPELLSSAEFFAEFGTQLKKGE